MARSDHRRYLKRTFPDFITPTTAICWSRYVRRCNATTDEDVSSDLTETWRILSTKDTQDTSVPPRGPRTIFRKSSLSLVAKKKKGIGQLDRDRRDDRPKRNARDDKTQFELKTALL